MELFVAVLLVGAVVFALVKGLDRVGEWWDEHGGWWWWLRGRDHRDHRNGHRPDVLLRCQECRHPFSLKSGKDACLVAGRLQG
jgi:hypothetical protein